MSLVLVITKLCNSYKSQFTSKSVLVWKETNSHTKTLIPHLLEVLKCPIYSFPRIYSYKIFHHYWMGGMNQKNSERMSHIDARNYTSCRGRYYIYIIIKGHSWYHQRNSRINRFSGLRRIFQWIDLRMVGVTLKVLYNDDMSEEFQKNLHFLVDQK